jgi:hypothetical protein
MVLQGCWTVFNSRVNCLMVCECDARPAGLHINYGTKILKVKLTLLKFDHKCTNGHSL